jgi:nitroimidazol reductase NimA-like FMN-containing flavoprotein (pyridoxamine 5'-phosphate oxidase superfamily)
MKGIRRREKEIKSKDEIIRILKNTRYVTIAMCEQNNPYLVTLNHGYDSKKNAVYFHCAKEGKKIDILRKNNVVWGQALIDKGYVSDKCDHLFATAQFMGEVVFINDSSEKKHALETMIKQHEQDPEKVIKKQITEESIKRVNIGRIDIIHLSGKKADKIIKS